jgi:hypothetical protein
VSVPLYMDHHVPSAVTEGLRRRGVDVLTAFEDGRAEASDEAILECATAQGRSVFTHDEDFLAIAARWQEAARQFAGIVFASQGSMTIGETIEWLELIAKASEPEHMLNGIQFVPLR